MGRISVSPNVKVFNNDDFWFAISMMTILSVTIDIFLRVRSLSISNIFGRLQVWMVVITFGHRFR